MTRFTHCIEHVLLCAALVAARPHPFDITATFDPQFGLTQSDFNYNVLNTTGIRQLDALPQLATAVDVSSTPSSRQSVKIVTDEGVKTMPVGQSTQPSAAAHNRPRLRHTHTILVFEHVDNAHWPPLNMSEIEIVDVVHERGANGSGGGAVQLDTTTAATTIGTVATTTPSVTTSMFPTTTTSSSVPSTNTTASVSGIVTQTNGPVTTSPATVTSTTTQTATTSARAVASSTAASTTTINLSHVFGGQRFARVVNNWGIGFDDNDGEFRVDRQQGVNVSSPRTHTRRIWAQVLGMPFGADRGIQVGGERGLTVGDTRQYGPWRHSNSMTVDWGTETTIGEWLSKLASMMNHTAQ